MFEKLKETGKRVKREIVIYRLLLKDKRTPKLAKVFLGLAVGYFVMPFDIIPDFIPVLGHLDDAVVIPALLLIARKLIPKELMDEYRKREDL